MPTHLTADEMKALIRQHFEDFVNNKRAKLIATTWSLFSGIPTDRTARRSGSKKTSE